jgi:hypothetical protein
VWSHDGPQCIKHLHWLLEVPDRYHWGNPKAIELVALQTVLEISETSLDYLWAGVSWALGNMFEEHKGLEESEVDRCGICVDRTPFHETEGEADYPEGGG